jgi:hypothetical protein
VITIFRLTKTIFCLLSLHTGNAPDGAKPMSASQIFTAIIVIPPLLLCAAWLIHDGIQIAREISADRNDGRL